MRAARETRDSRGAIESRALPDFIVHLSPAALVLAGVGVSWPLPWLGGALFMGSALAYASIAYKRLDWIAGAKKRRGGTFAQHGDGRCRFGLGVGEEAAVDELQVGDALLRRADAVDDRRVALRARQQLRWRELWPPFADCSAHGSSGCLRRLPSPPMNPNPMTRMSLACFLVVTTQARPGT